MIDSETLLSVRSKISSARLIRSFHPHSAHLNGIKVWLNPTDLTIWFFIFLALCSRGFVWVTRSGAWNCYAGMCSSGLKNLQWLWLPHCLEMSFLCFWLPFGFPDSLSKLSSYRSSWWRGPETPMRISNWGHCDPRGPGWLNDCLNERLNCLAWQKSEKVQDIWNATHDRWICMYIYIYVEMLVSGVALAIHLFYLLAPLTAPLELVVQCI